MVLSPPSPECMIPEIKEVALGMDPSLLFSVARCLHAMFVTLSCISSYSLKEIMLSLGNRAMVSLNWKTRLPCGYLGYICLMINE